MSLWDTYRTLHPLLHLIAPEYAADFLRSLLKMGTARGALPRWPIAHGDGNSMIGTPADIVAADARLRGVAGPDYEALYALMKKAATEGDPNGMRSARESYAALGYCPADEVGGSVSVTLEQMWADFAIGQLGTALGKPDDPAMFAARAARFGEIYDGPRGFFRGRKADGTFLAAGGFDPTTNTEEYVEGNAWQYLWLAPWNADELARVLGGRDAAVAKLDEFFRLSMERPPEELAGVRLPDLYYWHGNEPGLHTAYLYVLWRRPDKAAEVVRWILRSKYANAPAGLDGNDDGGTLSSWYVWSAMGLYPIAATSRYLVGSPLFTRSVIRLAGGKSFTIEAAKASAENMYVQSAAWDGKPLLDPWFDHSDVAKGGTLALEMGSAPSDWGR
jgi:predicted alpha-1,2-mannosidase